MPRRGTRSAALAHFFDGADAAQGIDEDLLAGTLAAVNGIAVRLFRFGQGNLLDGPSGLFDSRCLFAVRRIFLGLGLEFADDLFSFDAKAALEVDGIAAAGIDDVLPLGRDLVFFPAQVVFQFPCLFQAIGQFCLFVNFLAWALNRSGRLHIHVLGLAAQFLGLFEDSLRHAQAFTDAEGVGTAGRTDAQLIRRLQRFHIEFDVAVFNARRIVGVIF